MNRRQLFALAAGVLLTPEGLWVPGEKRIFLPPKQRMVENVILKSESFEMPLPWLSPDSGWKMGQYHHITINLAHPNVNQCPNLYVMKHTQFLPTLPHMTPYYRTGHTGWLENLDIPESVWKRKGCYGGRIIERADGQLQLVL